VTGKTEVATEGLTLPLIEPCLPATDLPRHSIAGTAPQSAPLPGEPPALSDLALEIVEPKRPLVKKTGGLFAIGAAVTAGLLVAWLARPLRAPSAVAAVDSLPATQDKAGPFLLSRLPDQPFASMEAALTATCDGDTLSIYGNGPFPVQPIKLRGKELVIRAAPGYRPRLQLAGNRSYPAWEPLLSTDRALTIDGLELLGKRDAPDTLHLLYAERAPLRIVNCNLRAEYGRGLIVCRDTENVELKNCELKGDSALICVEVSDGRDTRMLLDGCKLATTDPRGAALSLWPVRQGSGAVNLQLERNHIEAGRVLALGQGFNALAVECHGGTFVFHEALLSLAGPGAPQAWRQVVHWQGSHNSYQSEADWLQFDGRAAAVSGLSAWRDFWRTAESGSVALPSVPVQAAFPPLVH
jgi:hypothetical protein